MKMTGDFLYCNAQYLMEIVWNCLMHVLHLKFIFHSIFLFLCSLLNFSFSSASALFHHFVPCNTEWKWKLKVHSGLCKSDIIWAAKKQYCFTRTKDNKYSQRVQIEMREKLLKFLLVFFCNLFHLKTKLIWNWWCNVSHAIRYSFLWF